MAIGSPGVTIASSGTKSNALRLGNSALIGVALPAAFTGTHISFEVSQDGVTFTPLNSEAGAISVAIVQGRAVSVPDYWLRPWRYVKIVSDATETSARAITLATVR